MPITNEERAKLELAVASFEIQDSVAVARLLWETLNAARTTPENQGGLGPDQIFALGRLIYDKAEWPALAKVEEATGRRPIRFPLMRAVEGVFRAGLSNGLPKLPEEHRQALGTVLAKMDPDELKLLTVLLYDTLLSTEFAVTNDAKVIHPVAKFLAPGWTWEQLKQMEPVVAGICVPLVNACHNYFREHFPTIFRSEDEENITATPTDQTPPSPPLPVDPNPEPTTPEIALSPDEEEAAATDQEGGVSASDPFVEDAASQVSAAETQTEEDTHVLPPEHPSETLSEPSKTSDPTDDASKQNGHRLSKKERRELKRLQRQEANK